MVRYRNMKTGRVYERPAPDEWLEASAGWERVDEPVKKRVRRLMEENREVLDRLGGSDERTDD